MKILEFEDGGNLKLIVPKHGSPVLRLESEDGQFNDFVQDDTLEGYDFIEQYGYKVKAGKYVYDWSNNSRRTAEEYETAQLFLAHWGILRIEDNEECNGIGIKHDDFMMVDGELKEVEKIENLQKTEKDKTVLYTKITFFGGDWADFVYMNPNDAIGRWIRGRDSK